MAQAIDLAGITNTSGVPRLRVFCEERALSGAEGAGVGNAGAKWVDHVSTTKSNSTRSVAAHSCKKRKDRAPSVGMVRAKIVKLATRP